MWVSLKIISLLAEHTTRVKRNFTKIDRNFRRCINRQKNQSATSFKIGFVSNICESNIKIQTLMFQAKAAKICSFVKLFQSCFTWRSFFRFLCSP